MEELPSEFEFELCSPRYDPFSVLEFVLWSLPQTALNLGHFQPFLGSSSDISWSSRATKRSLSRGNRGACGV